MDHPFIHEHLQRAQQASREQSLRHAWHRSDLRLRRGPRWGRLRALAVRLVATARRGRGYSVAPATPITRTEPRACSYR